MADKRKSNDCIADMVDGLNSRYSDKRQNVFEQRVAAAEEAQFGHDVYKLEEALQPKQVEGDYVDEWNAGMLRVYAEREVFGHDFIDGIAVTSFVGGVPKVTIQSYDQFDRSKMFASDDHMVMFDFYVGHVGNYVGEGLLSDDGARRVLDKLCVNLVSTTAGFQLDNTGLEEALLTEMVVQAKKEPEA